MGKSRQKRRSRKPFSLVHRKSISKGLIRFWDKKGRKKKEDKNKFKRQLIIGGVVTSAGALGLLLATKKIKKDLKVSQVDFNSIRQPPGGIPDLQTLANYDKFIPGSLIKKNIKSDRLGIREHYAVYVGKDKFTGEHMLIDTGIDWKNRDGVPYIRKRGLTWDVGPNDSEYIMVNPKTFSRDSKIFSAQEIQERADLMLYQRFRYEGFSSNCEAFARSIVEGRAYSTQASKVSNLTGFVSKHVTDKLLMLRSPKDYFPGTENERVNNIIASLTRNKVTGLSDYFRERHKWSAGQIAEFLNNRDLLNIVIDPKNPPDKNTLKLIAKIREMEKIRSARRVSWEYLENPYGKDSPQKRLNPVQFSKQETSNLEAYTFTSDIFFQNTKTPIISRQDRFLNSFGLKAPDKVEEDIKNISKAYSPILRKELEVSLISDYLFLVFYCLKSVNKEELINK